MRRQYSAERRDLTSAKKKKKKSQTPRLVTKPQIGCEDALKRFLLSLAVQAAIIQLGNHKSEKGASNPPPPPPNNNLKTKQRG